MVCPYLRAIFLCVYNSTKTLHLPILLHSFCKMKHLEEECWFYFTCTVFKWLTISVQKKQSTTKLKQRKSLFQYLMSEKFWVCFDNNIGNCQKESQKVCEASVKLFSFIYYCYYSVVPKTEFRASPILGYCSTNLLQILLQVIILYISCLASFSY